MVLQLGELCPGLVAYIDPHRLAEYGATCDLAPQFWIQGIHPFVCLRDDGRQSIWAVLSSSSSNGRRIEIPLTEKAGTPAWCERATFLYDARQIWYGPNFAFVEGSVLETTLVRQRNTITQSFVDQVRRLCWLPNQRQLEKTLSSATHDCPSEENV